jgi:CheY-like chemotaxis protein
LSDNSASGIVTVVPETVLVVDDDEAVRAAIAETLDIDGYAVLTAANGEEALHVLGGAPRPCVVVVDLVMPRVDGWELTDALAELRDVIVVCITAGRHTPPASCHALLRKPFDGHALVATVRGAFARLRE